MWARNMELTLAMWVAISPFVMRHDNETWLWVHDFTVASLVASIALLSYARRFPMVHLLQLPISFWLVGYGWWHSYGHPIPVPAAYQNWIVVGMLLMLFAIVPNHASSPPGHVPSS